MQNDQETGQFKNTNLLNDNLADSDAFGSHKSIADAISQLIEKEPGKKSIALIGPRGSGKSSVINFLAQQTLGNTKSESCTRLYVFDAWAHSGDPLRRVFLENLIEYLAEQGWIKKEDWQKDLDILSKRRETVTTKFKPFLTWPGRLIALSALLLPVGYALFSLLDNNNSHPSGIFKWGPLVGGGLIVAPIVIGAFSIAVYAIGKFFQSKCGWDGKFWKFNFKRFLKDDPILLFANERKEDYTIDTLKTIDPTSIEFRDVFQRLLIDALNINNDRASSPNNNLQNRKLIIVIDNLDRIEPESAEGIWATMRTFFEVDHPAIKKQWLEKISLVVPFVIDCAGDIFGDTDDGETARDSESKASVGESFIEKTFQSVFYVPLPIISGRKEFMITHLGMAFPAHNSHKKNEFYLICQMFEILNKNIPTPRDIKVFINQIGSHNRIWGDKIPLSVQALYVLCRPQMETNQKFLMDGSNIERRLKSLLSDQDWQKYFAALHFNLPPDRALEVLMGKDVLNALTAGKDDQIKTFVKDVPGCVTIIQNTVNDNYQEWAKDNPIALTMAANAIAPAISSDLPERNHIFNRLREGAMDVGSWKTVEPDIVHGLLEILNSTSEDDRDSTLKQFISSISQTCPEIKEGSPTPLSEPEMDKFVEGLFVFIDYVTKNEKSDLLKAHFKITGSPNAYIHVLAALSRNPRKEKYQNYFVSDKPTKNIVEEYTKVSADGSFGEVHAKSVLTARIIGESWDWNPLVKMFNERMQTASPLKPPEVGASMLAFTLLAETQDAVKQSLLSLCANGHVFHHVHQMNNHPKELASAFLAITKYLPTGAVQANVKQSANGVQLYQNILASPSENKELLKYFCELLVEHHQLHQFLDAMRSNKKGATFVSEVLKIILTEEKHYPLLSPEKIIEDYAYFVSLLPVEILDAYLTWCIKSNNFTSRLIEHSFNVDSSALQLKILNLCGGSAPLEYVTFLINGLVSVSKDDWSNALETKSSLLELMIVLRETHGKDIGLSTEFHGALLDHSQKVIDGSADPSILKGKTKAIVHSLQKNWQKIFLNDLRDRFVIEQHDKLKAPILELYQEFFVETDILEAKADEIVRRLFMPMLESNNENELAMLYVLIENKPDIIKKSDPGTQKAFRQKCDAVLREDTIDDKIKQSIQRIVENPTVAQIRIESVDQEQPSEP